MKVSEIRKSKHAKAFIKEFKRVLENLGEPLFEPISNELIFDRLEHQGYWAGVAYRISVDEDGSIGYQRRTFGGAV